MIRQRKEINPNIGEKIKIGMKENSVIEGSSQIPWSYGNCKHKLLFVYVCVEGHTSTHYDQPRNI